MLGPAVTKAERPSETPAVDANLDPARPANANGIFSKYFRGISRSRGVVRA